MTKELHYPIKYAVLELKEKGGYSVGYEDITYGFIASKCYVLGSSIRYNSNGSYSINHKVVFPYEDISCLEVSLKYDKTNIGNEQIPSFDACSRPYPINIVDSLFDSYEDAKLVAEEKNEEYRKSLVSKAIARGVVTSSNYDKYIEIIENDFDDKLKLSYLFEQLSLDATKNMDITLESPSKTQDSIKVLHPMKK